MKTIFKAWTAIAIGGVTLCVILFVYYAMHLHHPEAAKEHHAAAPSSTSSMFSDPLKTHNGEIEVYSFLPLNATEPFQALAEALKIKKNSNRFRVIWGAIEPGGPMDGTMVYDKKRRLIKLYDENWFHGSYWRFEYLITNVSDEDIKRYLNEYAKWPHPVKIGFYSFIGIFRTYGCDTYRLERKFKGLYANEKPWWPDVREDITGYHSKKTS